MSTLQAIYLRLKNILVHLLHFLSSTKENRSKYLLIRASVLGRGGAFSTRVGDRVAGGQEQMEGMWYFSVLYKYISKYSLPTIHSHYFNLFVCYPDVDENAV